GDAEQEQRTRREYGGHVDGPVGAGRYSRPPRRAAQGAGGYTCALRSGIAEVEMLRMLNWALALLLALALPAYGSGGGDGAEAAAEGAQYVALKPPFVTNYGSDGATRFLKADITLR